jgi:endonuclease/exonuclease/phosphatase (EEP) superfamily protein YafD
VRYLRERGYQDALRQYAPHTSTWRWQLGPIPRRGQLDHIVYSPSLRCLNARVLRRGASDHYPVLATFAVRERPPAAAQGIESSGGAGVG